MPLSGRGPELGEAQEPLEKALAAVPSYRQIRADAEEAYRLASEPCQSHHRPPARREPDYEGFAVQLLDRFERAAEGLSPLDRAELAERYSLRLEAECAAVPPDHAARIDRLRARLLGGEAERLRRRALEPSLSSADRSLIGAWASALSAMAALQTEGSRAGLAALRRLREMARDTSLGSQTQGAAAACADRLASQVGRKRAEELATLPPEAALAGAQESARELGLQPADLLRQVAVRMGANGNEEAANHLRGLDAERELDERARAESLSPTQRALAGLDLAARLLEDGYGPAAARLLEREAGLARKPGAGRDPSSRLLGTFAEAAEARAAAYRAQSPRDGFKAAEQLRTSARGAREEAQCLRAEGKPEEARFAETLGASSMDQADEIEKGARRTDSALGKGILETYQRIVEASFDERIEKQGTWLGLYDGPKRKLVADKERMQTVFAELRRIMTQEGVSLDVAWNKMVKDETIDGFRGTAPLVPGFPTRSEAAKFLRDHEVTRDLLSPFCRMASGFTRGEGAAIDEAQAELVRVLRQHGQWELAGKALEGYRKAARTSEGRAEAARLEGSARGEWWQAAAADFAGRELPVLLLTGVLTGGAGWGARALAGAAGMGIRATRSAQVAAELGLFVPTERVVGELALGRRSDWSKESIGRDYLLTLGGYALFRSLGAGWRKIREGSAERILAGSDNLPRGADARALVDLLRRDPAAGLKELERVLGKDGKALLDGFARAPDRSLENALAVLLRPGNALPPDLVVHLVLRQGRVTANELVLLDRLAGSKIDVAAFADGKGPTIGDFGKTFSRFTPAEQALTLERAAPGASPAQILDALASTRQELQDISRKLFQPRAEIDAEMEQVLRALGPGEKPPPSRPTYKDVRRLLRTTEDKDPVTRATLRTHRGKYEGFVDVRVLRANAQAYQRMRQLIRRHGPDVVVGTERGGAFIADVLEHGDPKLAPKTLRPAKLPADQMYPALRDQLEAQIRAGKRRFMFVDAYMGGFNAEYLVERVFAPLLEKYGDKFPDLRFGSLWIREKWGLEFGEGVDRFAGPGRWSKHIFGEAVDVPWIFGDDVNLIMGGTERGAVHVYLPDGTVARSLKPSAGETTRSLAIRLLNGEGLEGLSDVH